MLQFLWIGTHLRGERNQRATGARHGRTTRQAGPAGAAAPAPCHVLGPNQVLPKVHNLDE
jgi:hypothetical protein